MHRRSLCSLLAALLALPAVLGAAEPRPKAPTTLAEARRLADRTDAALIGTEAQGGVVSVYQHAWLNNAVGVAFDGFGTTEMIYFHEPTNSVRPLASGIWRVAVDDPSQAEPVRYTKLGGLDVDGGTVRPGDGAIFAADFNGNNDVIDDNIYLFDRDGDTIAFWETDRGLAGPPCSGPAIDQIVDLAYDPVDPTRLYATNFGDNKIYSVVLTDTAGGTTAPSGCIVDAVFDPPAGFGNVASIEFDPCNQGYWLTDFDSSQVALVAGPASFDTVVSSFTTEAPSSFNSGIAVQVRPDRRPLLWQVDLNDQVTYVLRSGLDRCPAGM